MTRLPTALVDGSILGGALVLLGIPLLGFAIVYQRLYYLLDIPSAGAWHAICYPLGACTDTTFVILPTGITTGLVYAWLWQQTTTRGEP